MEDHSPIHGGQLELLANHFKVDPSKLLDFSANINPDGPPASVMQALRKGLEDASSLTQYPDLEQSALKRAVAASVARHQAEVSIANGFVPLLEAALRALPISSCLLPMPAFNEYRPALMRAQIDVVPYALSASSGFMYDTAAMLSAEQDAVLLANPQNPSGALASVGHMLQLIQVAADKNMYVLLDEAFIDYVPEDSMAPYTNRYPKLILFRSVTKFYGIPGLRVAYCLSQASTAVLINAHLPPWPVSNLASTAVQAALGDEPYAERARRVNRERRARLFNGLSVLKLDPQRGAANFLLFRLPTTVEPAAFWKAMIVHHRIVLRSCENYVHLPSGYLRTAVRDDVDNERLLRALADELSR